MYIHIYMYICIHAYVYTCVYTHKYTLLTGTFVYARNTIDCYSYVVPVAMIIYHIKEIEFNLCIHPQGNCITTVLLTQKFILSFYVQCELNILCKRELVGESLWHVDISGLNNVVTFWIKYLHTNSPAEWLLCSVLSNESLENIKLHANGLFIMAGLHYS